jgi:hypothetical protein
MCGAGLPVGVRPGLGIIQSHAAHPQAAKLLFSSQINSRPAMFQDPHYQRGTGAGFNLLLNAPGTSLVDAEYRTTSVGVHLGSFFAFAYAVRETAMFR